MTVVVTDHYATLGIPRDAQDNVIVRAWREAASLHHPDRGGDAAHFTAAREAFNVLMDRAKRAAHDRELNPAKAVAATISNGDFIAMSMTPFAGKWADDPASCPCCDGAREVRISQDGFWLRKACPACA